LVDEALAFIGAIYEAEAHIGDNALAGEAKLNYIIRAGVDVAISVKKAPP
jgi:hypothetical protein